MSRECLPDLDEYVLLSLGHPLQELFEMLVTKRFIYYLSLIFNYIEY